MRHVAIGSLFAVVIGLAATNTSLSWVRQKETVVSHANPLFKEPPPSLREMSLKADAVVYGRVLGGSVKAAGFYRPEEPGVLTLNRIRVFETLQSFGIYPVDANEITVIHDGGVLDRGARLEQVEIDNFPQLDLGGEYVLFLLWHAEHKAWITAWGPHGVFRVKNGRIEAVGFATISKGQNGLPLEEFLTRIRRLS